jgi:hypothetical protein
LRTAQSKNMNSSKGIPAFMNEPKKELTGVILWSRVLIEKLRVAELFKKFPAIYRIYNIWPLNCIISRLHPVHSLILTCTQSTASHTLPPSPQPHTLLHPVLSLTHTCTKSTASCTLAPSPHLHTYLRPVHSLMYSRTQPIASYTFAFSPQPYIQRSIHNFRDWCCHLVKN